MRLILNKLWNFKLPISLALIIIFAAAIGPKLAVETQSFLYFLSIAFKELLLFVLPFIIFSLILSSLVHLKGGVMKLILILLPLLCVSNFISIWIAYFAGSVIVPKADLTLLTALSTKDLAPTWDFELPRLISSQTAMILAAITGIASTKYFPETGEKVSLFLNKITAFILNKIVLPCLPIMILGFVVKMQHDDVLEEMVRNYAYIFATVSLLQAGYIIFLYMAAAKFKTSEWLVSIKNMISPFITAFSTLSSAITMPLTLIGTRKNLHEPDLANFVVPSTVNFHLIGDCLAMPIFSMAIMVSFGYGMPTMSQYFIFSLYYTLARFSAAGIPGGGALVLMPLLESQFKFTSNMLGMIPTLNLMFDPMITAMNVLGNGVFAIVFAKIYHASSKKSGNASSIGSTVKADA